MENFNNFRIVLYTRDRHRICRLHADLPHGKGLDYIFFVLYERELEQFASASCLLSDGYHKLEVWGDLCRFFDLDLPSQVKHGIAPISYYSASIPRFVRRLILRIAQGVWARATNEETTVELSADRVARWPGLYGVGSGAVEVVMNDDTRAFLDEKLGEPGSNLCEKVEQIKPLRATAPAHSSRRASCACRRTGTASSSRCRACTAGSSITATSGRSGRFTREAAHAPHCALLGETVACECRAGGYFDVALSEFTLGFEILCGPSLGVQNESVLLLLPACSDVCSSQCRVRLVVGHPVAFPRRAVGS